MMMKYDFVPVLLGVGPSKPANLVTGKKRAAVTVRWALLSAPDPTAAPKTPDPSDAPETPDKN